MSGATLRSGSSAASSNDGALDAASGSPSTDLATGRGTTQIAPAVVEKIAAQAVREVDDATGTARHVLGIAVGSTDESTQARVSADVDGSIATVKVTMTVIYPASVRDVTQETRQRVVDRVLDLAGVHVREVDITVAGLRAERIAPPRVR